MQKTVFAVALHAALSSKFPGETQGSWADRVGVAANTMSTWLAGGALPHLRYLDGLVQLLGPQIREAYHRADLDRAAEPVATGQAYELRLLANRLGGAAGVAARAAADCLTARGADPEFVAFMVGLLQRHAEKQTLADKALLLGAAAALAA